MVLGPNELDLNTAFPVVINLLSAFGPPMEGFHLLTWLCALLRLKAV